MKIIVLGLGHVGVVAEIGQRVTPRSRILLVGLSFKAGTDDLRGSPLLSLAESLLDSGHDLAIYDPDLAGAAAAGTPARSSTRLSSRLSAIILSQLSRATAWDLVVIGKSCPDILPSINPNSRFLRIDRL